MAEVIPFKGVLYNPQKVESSLVMAPPYDIVTPEFKEILYNKSPYNIIRVDFGKDIIGDNEKENRYTRASKALDEWFQQGILIKDSAPAFYCYEVTYMTDGQEKRLRGLIGAIKLEELGRGKIHPHEMTYSKHRADRLDILRSCKANISPIFSLYSSPEKLTSSILAQASEGRSLIEGVDEEGFVHRLWSIKDKESIETMRRELSDKGIFIADGHHRYETAWEFRNEMKKKGLLKTGAEPFNYVMMFLANVEDNGLTILPTHRLAKIDKRIKIEELLKPYFDITPMSFNNVSTGDRIRTELFEAMRKGTHCLGMFLGDEKKYYLLRVKDPYPEINSPPALRTLDVTILHKLILERLLKVDTVNYEMNPELAVEKVRHGKYHAVFFLNPTKIEKIKEVALSGERMPPKSTYFYPKLLTGMVLYKF